MTGILLSLGLLILFSFLAYNRLVLLRKSADKSFAGFEDLAPKRYDLIPDLVAAAQTEPNSDPAMFTELAALRSEFIKGETSAERKVELDNKVTILLKKITETMEKDRQEESGHMYFIVESRLQVAEQELNVIRKKHNTAVLDYNNAIYLFPSNVFAIFFGFKPRKLFDL